MSTDGRGRRRPAGPRPRSPRPSAAPGGADALDVVALPDEAHRVALPAPAVGGRALAVLVDDSQLAAHGEVDVVAGARAEIEHAVDGAVGGQVSGADA